MKDLTGQKFGRLVVLRVTDKRKNGRIVWKCRCNCGNETEVVSSYLIHGETKSCGCYQKESQIQSMTKLRSNKKLLDEAYKKLSEVNKIDLKGKRFGRLLVIQETDKRGSNGTIRWECRCDCGNSTYPISKNLISGETRSCGCLKEEIRKENLVEDTKLDNLTQKKRIDNTSGVKGVSKNKKTGKYEAHIGFQKRKIHLGTYETLQEAKMVRQKAEEEIFKPILDKYRDS
jgi:hypothetical protein